MARTLDETDDSWNCHQNENPNKTYCIWIFKLNTVTQYIYFSALLMQLKSTLVTFKSGMHVLRCSENCVPVVKWNQEVRFHQRAKSQSDCSIEDSEAWSQKSVL